VKRSPVFTERKLGGPEPVQTVLEKGKSFAPAGMFLVMLVLWAINAQVTSVNTSEL
jgi:hypothetical protein